METQATPTVGTPEERPAVGGFSRLIGVIVNPRATFADIARRPTWVLPFLLFCGLSLVVGALLGQKTDWHDFFERQMSKNARFDQMSQTQKDQMLENQVKYAPKVSFLFGFLGTAVTVLLMALIYWGMFNLFTGAGLRFGQAFGITSHAFVPSMIGGVLAIIIILIKPRGEVDPEHFLASSLSAFLPDGSPHWLESLGQSLELFWILSLALLAIGFSAANPKKIKTVPAFLVVFGLWGILVFAKVAWAAL